MRVRVVVCFVQCLLGFGVVRADAQTFLYFHSEPGEELAHGATFSLTPADGVITAEVAPPDPQLIAPSAVHVAFRGAQYWDLYFAAPGNVPLGPGMFEGAYRWPYESAHVPGLSVYPSGVGCLATGRFVVLAIGYGPGGEVLSLAIDYEQHCGVGSPALYGSVRYNSNVAQTPRLSVSSASNYERNGEPRTLGFVLSLSTPAMSSVSVDYATSDGSASAGQDYVATAGTAVFQPGQTAIPIPVRILGDTLEEDDEILFIRLSNPVGASITFGEGPGTILNDDPYATFILIDSQEGDYVGTGRHLMLTNADGEITPDRNFGNGVHVDFVNGLVRWDLDFAAAGAPLATGVYDRAVRWPFQPPDRSGLSVSGDGRGCNNIQGRFEVLEAQYAPDGRVLRFAVDFEQWCDGDRAPMFGSVRFNSAAPVGPKLMVAATKSYEGDGEPRELVFSVFLSAPSPSPVSVEYFTTDGSATAGEDYQSVTGIVNLAVGQTSATVAVPILGDTLQEYDESLFLTLRNAVGSPLGFGQANGMILDDDPYKTFLSLASEDGHWVGRGQRFMGTLFEGTFQLQRVRGGGLRVFYDDFVGFPYWTLDFKGPNDAPLVPGLYIGAMDTGPGPLPGLDFAGSGRACNRSDGRFVVLDAEYGPQGEVLRFAADFEQHCEGDVPSLFGSFRYRSGVPLTPPTAAEAGFHTVAPCRLHDTRNRGEAMPANTTRSIDVLGVCGVPGSARAVALNLTAVSPTDGGNLRLLPAAAFLPTASVLNFSPGQTRATGAVVPVGTAGAVQVHVDMSKLSNGTVHVVADVVGYFE